MTRQLAHPASLARSLLLTALWALPGSSSHAAPGTQPLDPHWVKLLPPVTVPLPRPTTSRTEDRPPHPVAAAAAPDAPAPAVETAASLPPVAAVPVPAPPAAPAVSIAAEATPAPLPVAALPPPEVIAETVAQDATSAMTSLQPETIADPVKPAPEPPAAPAVLARPLPGPPHPPEDNVVADIVEVDVATPAVCLEPRAPDAPECLHTDRWEVQILAGRSMRWVREDQRTFARWHRDLLDGLEMFVKKSRPTDGSRPFFQLRVGPMADGKTARAWCRVLKSRDADCLVIKSSTSIPIIESLQPPPPTDASPTTRVESQSTHEP